MFTLRAIANIYYSIRNLIYYRKPRPISIETAARIRGHLDGPVSTESVQLALTECFLAGVGLRLTDSKFGLAGVYITPIQVDAVNQVAVYGYRVRCG